jgi:photosystem II stability/assembly factor-like uncharacterized protein
MRRWVLRSGLGWVVLAALLGGAVADFEPARPEGWEIPDPDLYGVAAHGGRVWAVGYWGTLLRSEDGGTSWSRAPAGTTATLFDVSFADERHGWAVGEGGVILRSVDGGASWTRQGALVWDLLELETEPRPLDTHLFGVEAVSKDVAWAVGDLGIVLRVADGEHWQQVRIPEASFGDDEVPDRIFNAVRFADARHGWIVGEFGTTLRTADAGQTWTGTRSFSGAPDDLYLFDVAAADARRAAVVGLAGSVLVTEDGGETWQARGATTSAGFFGVHWRDGAGLAVGDRGEMFGTGNAGASWASPQRPTLFNWLSGVAQADARRLFVVGEKGLVLGSRDGGDTWTQLLGRRPPPLASVTIPQPKGEIPQDPVIPLALP